MFSDNIFKIYSNTFNCYVGYMYISRKNFISLLKYLRRVLHNFNIAAIHLFCISIDIKIIYKLMNLYFILNQISNEYKMLYALKYYRRL